ncbi:MAG: hypothetical protein JEZ08_03050 [Clostridiales bacterium]|nr:hypothetical protein [Clostridiales bacterium]
MQKKSLLTTFSFSAITTLIGIVVLFGTIMMAFIIRDIEKSEELLDQSISSYKSELELPLDELSSFFENAQVYFYKQVNQTLDMTIEYLLNNYDLFERGNISSILLVEDALKLYPESLYDGYFILSKNGDIILDETGFLAGNLTEMMDDSGEKVFSSELNVQNVSEFHFSSSWMTSNDLETYYASFKELNNNYYIGLLTNKKNTVETYKKEYISRFKNISELHLSRFHIIDLNGQVILGNITLSKSEIDDLLESRSVDRITELNHATYGSLYYQIFPELNWIIINQDYFMNNMSLMISNTIVKRNTQLIFLIHLVVLIISGIILAFAILSKRTKKKLDHQFNILNKSIISNSSVEENNILYSEFKRVAQVFNKLTRAKENAIVTKEKIYEEDQNKSYFMKMIKHQLVDSHLLNSNENFNLKPLIYECMESMKLENSVFKADIICEQDIKMNQNKALIQGLIYFFVSNLIFNTGFLKENNITIEVCADNENVNLSFVRNVNKRSQPYKHIIYNVFEEIDDVIIFNLGGSFDYSNYEHADSKLIIQFPLVN